MKVELTVDRYSDAAYVALTPDGIDRTDIVKKTLGVDCSKGTVNLDFDHEGRLVGIELLGFALRKDVA